MFLNNEFRIDFVGIGASKSGTTWVSKILKSHDRIYMPTIQKELYFFNELLPQDYYTKNYNFNNSINWYHDFFKERLNNQIVGEITPCYLSIDNTAQHIYEYNPKIKIFVILRDPVKRSFSEYLFSKQNGICSYKNFNEAIKDNPSKFLNSSLYYKNLLPYFNLFPKENIKVFIYEDIISDNISFVEDLYRFLGVDTYIPNFINDKVNVSKVVKYGFINNFIGKSKMFIHKNGFQFVLPLLKNIGFISLIKKVKLINVSNSASKEVLSFDDEIKFYRFFENDIKALENFLNVNLNKWKK